ncbi:MAG: hypothetical protein ACRD19_07595 [Terriglobia bacterium]
MMNMQATCVGEGVSTVSFNPPDTCPLCHTKVDPRTLSAVVKRPRNKGQLQVIFQCTSALCDSLFISYYSSAIPNNTQIYTFERSAPSTAHTISFRDEVSEVSPVFVEIYNQTLAAEAANLQHLTGIGLRKALEFLIKDFAIKEHVPDQATIEKIQLGPCIEKYVDDGNIKNCAKRAAWLGNDETHYVRKWTDKDVGDLKILIDLTVNWITNVLLTRKYITEMH